jgi:hypothetical protein
MDRARYLDSATAKILFVVDEPKMELKERFTLLTVAAGLRHCALFVHLGPSDLQHPPNRIFYTLTTADSVRLPARRPQDAH